MPSFKQLPPPNKHIGKGAADLMPWGASPLPSLREGKGRIILDPKKNNRTRIRRMRRTLLILVIMRKRRKHEQEKYLPSLR